MGVVYEATDGELERRVAVKLLREDKVWRPETMGRFRREARALAAFSHPNVVTIHDFGVSTDGRAFLVMEYLVGPTLRQLLRGEGALPPPRALEILQGIVAAVEAAHRHRIVHRDLKPENVILSRGDTGEVPKVLDFGLARLAPGGGTAEGETDTRGVAGTPRYMAPEQMSGAAVDPSWDRWALAVIAYEMLTGVHPFESRELADPRAVRLVGRFVPVAPAPGLAARQLDDFFAHAFAPRPEDRPCSATALLTGLKDALAGYAGST